MNLAAHMGILPAKGLKELSILFLAYNKLN